MVASSTSIAGSGHRRSKLNCTGNLVASGVSPEDLALHTTLRNTS
jgi:hypothetical protein